MPLLGFRFKQLTLISTQLKSTHLNFLISRILPSLGSRFERITHTVLLCMLINMSFSGYCASHFHSGPGEKFEYYEEPSFLLSSSINQLQSLAKVLMFRVLHSQHPALGEARQGVPREDTSSQAPCLFLAIIIHNNTSSQGKEKFSEGLCRKAKHTGS